MHRTLRADIDASLISTCACFYNVFRAAYELKKEARALFLQHDNIVAMHAIIFDNDPGHHGLVMEYVLHGSLEDFIFNYHVWCSLSDMFISP